MGLFDGGFDMDALMKMIGPDAANAANAIGPNGAPTAPLTPDALMGSPQAQSVLAGVPKPVIPQPITPTEVGPGVAPPPTDGRPVEPPPNNIMTLNAGAPEPPVAPGGIGAALRGTGVDNLQARAPASGAEGPTAPSTPSAEPQRPSLAQALKGAQMPAAPVQQKISSPNAPRPTGQIKAGDLQALLLALNAAGGPGMPRPTLGRG